MTSTKKSNFFSRIYTQLKFKLIEVYNARGSRHEIALGASIGAFWGVFPTFGLSTILSALLSKVFRFNLLVAISAAFISNPITSPFFLMISYKMGTCFIQTNIQFENIKWKEDLTQIGYIMLIGSTIISTITALLVYLITSYTIKYKRKKVE
jgi:uncharacterized protein